MGGPGRIVVGVGGPNWDFVVQRPSLRVYVSKCPGFETGRDFLSTMARHPFGGNILTLGNVVAFLIYLRRSFGSTGSISCSSDEAWTDSSRIKP